MKRNSKLFGSIAIAACAVLSLAGCGTEHGHDESSDHDHGAATETAAEAKSPIQVSPEMEAVLVKADMVDGTEDHVVSQCTGCGLAMEGSADHMVQVGDFEMHFCSDQCKDGFEAAAEESILALAVAEEVGDTATP